MSVNSPRRPSVPSERQRRVAVSKAQSGVTTEARPARAASIRLRSFRSSPDHFLRKAFGSRSNASRRLTTSIRVGTSVGVLTSTASPKRSRSCGRKLALFRIAAADQHEARRMAHAQALAFDDIHPGGRHVEQEIDKMILQKIDFVDVEKAAVGQRKQPRLERFFTARKRPFEIERADDAILGRAEREFDHRDRLRCAFERAARRAGAAGPRTSPRARRVRNGRGTRRPRAFRAAAQRSARTAVDFPVPRSPKTRTPPIAGSTAAIRKAIFISSWPTIAEKGKGLCIPSSWSNQAEVGWRRGNLLQFLHPPKPKSFPAPKDRLPAPGQTVHFVEHVAGMVSIEVVKDLMRGGGAGNPERRKQRI